MAHKKHPDQTRKSQEGWATHEVALIGAPCSVLLEFVMEIANALGDQLNLGYLDSSHGNTTPTHPNLQIMTEFQKHWNIETSQPQNKYSHKIRNNDLDLLLVNGNHHLAKRQIVFIHEKKRDSLLRKLDRLTDVFCIVLTNEGQEVYPELKPYLAADTPIFQINEMERTASYVSTIAPPPTLIGLVLSGGQSTRMGRDKALIEYHGLPQKDYVKKLMNKHTHEVYFSIGNKIEKSEVEIADQFLNLGPLGGILSAFKKNPNVAWLTMPVDMPMITEEAVDFLVSHRNRSKIATCFYNNSTQFPDPLFTIWEPKAYLHLLQFLMLGYNCPRKVLINSDVELLHPAHQDWLLNVNTPQEMKQIKKQTNATV